jgi:hypothetical protein
MRSIDTLVPPIENDNSSRLSEDNASTIKAIEEMATAMKEVVESSTSNTNKTLETFKTAFDKQFTTPDTDVDNKNVNGADEPESDSDEPESED